MNNYKAVVPDVYNRVKDQSDTFFIKQALGPNYNTQNVRISDENPKFKKIEPEAHLVATPARLARSRSPQYGSNTDLFNLDLGDTGLEVGPKQLSAEDSAGTLPVVGG